jgi:hypothetical protein
VVRRGTDGRNDLEAGTAAASLIGLSFERARAPKIERLSARSLRDADTRSAATRL